MRPAARFFHTSRLVTATILIGVLGLVGGCAINHPQTADEFRAGVPTAFMGMVDTFEVDRPVKDVAKSFEKKAPECLAVTIKTTSQTNTSYQVIVTTYNPTVLVHADKAELHLQQKFEQGVMTVGQVPPGGYYMMVVDATPAGKNKTRIDMYRSKVGHDLIVKAIKNWARGEDRGCPDLTKM